jgi:PEP-CTERM motif
MEEVGQNLAATLLPRLKDRKLNIFWDLLKERAMKLGFAAVSALTLMSVGIAGAATTGYNFDGPTTGTVNSGLGGAAPTNSLPQGGSSDITSGNVPFGQALTALGISSTSLSATTAGHPGGVNANSLQNPPIPGNFTGNAFDTGWLGVLTLNFSSPISSFAFDYWETEGAGGLGFTLAAYSVVNGSGNSNLVGTVQTIGFGAGLSASVTGGGIRSVVISDLGDAAHSTGDGVRIDNLVVTTPDAGVPEPSTYLMVGSALAGLAAFRRRRA